MQLREDNAPVLADCPLADSEPLRLCRGLNFALAIGADDNKKARTVSSAVKPLDRDDAQTKLGEFLGGNSVPFWNRVSCASSRCAICLHQFYDFLRQQSAV
jgi:hypothetical protein